MTLKTFSNPSVIPALMCAGLVACSPSAPQPEPEKTPEAFPEAANILSCTAPVGQAMTADTLTATFGDQARVETIPGPEGTTYRAVLLYPDTPERRVAVTFWDEAMTQVSDVTVSERAVAWQGPGEIGIGSTLKEVEAANGGPLTLYGFDWDYGGYVSDFKGGRLATIPGGCVFGLRFGLPESVDPELMTGISGDQPISSRHPNMQKAQPVVISLSVGWAAPQPLTAKPN